MKLYGFLGTINYDKNNFAFITDIYKEDSRDGFSMVELGDYMESLGCKFGVNLDGGGSTNLMFKSKNSSSPTGIMTSSRNIADILYFHE